MTNKWKHKEDSNIKESLHYTACGLDDVYLISGYKRIKTSYGEGISIKNLDELHKAIGHYLVTQKKVLSGKELRFLRKQMNLTQSELGKLVGLTSQQVARWEKGESTIKDASANLIRVLFMEHLGKRIKIRNLLLALEEKDEPAEEKHIFEETNHGWQQAA